MGDTAILGAYRSRLSRGKSAVIAVILATVTALAAFFVVSPQAQAADSPTVRECVRSNPTLREGVYNHGCVAALQGFLKEVVYPGLGIDGDFGHNTKWSVVVYQDRHGLRRDGIVGDATWSAIGRSCDRLTGLTCVTHFHY